MSFGPFGSSARCIKNQLGIRPYRLLLRAINHHQPIKSAFPYHRLNLFSTMSPSSKSKPQKVVIQLHYNDLRTHDSPVLSHVHSKRSSEEGITHFLPIYVFDERVVALSCVPGYEEFALKSVFNSTGSQQGQEGQEEKDQKKEKQEKDEARPTTIRGLGDLPRIPPSSSSSSSSSSSPKTTSNLTKIPHPKTRLGAFHKTSRHRLKFLTESVFNLRESYRGMGGDLVVGCGFMEGFVAGVVEALQNGDGRQKGEGENGEDDGGERYEVTEVWMQKEVRTRWGCFIYFGRFAVGPTLSPFSFPPPIPPPTSCQRNATNTTGQHRRSPLPTAPPRHPRTLRHSLETGRL